MAIIGAHGITSNQRVTPHGNGAGNLVGMIEPLVHGHERQAIAVDAPLDGYERLSTGGLGHMVGGVVYRGMDEPVPR